MSQNDLVLSHSALVLARLEGVNARERVISGVEEVTVYVVTVQKRDSGNNMLGIGQYSKARSHRMSMLILFSIP